MPRQSYLPYSRKQRIPLRPRDLVVKPNPPHLPSSPAELFVAALIDGDLLGLDTLLAEDIQHKIKIRIHVQEIKVSVVCNPSQR